MHNRLITLLTGATLIAPVSAAMLLDSAPVAAQSLAARIDAMPADETVHFTFASKPGVCGDGENISVRSLGPDGVTVEGGRRYTLHSGRRGSDWDRECVDGPVRMEIERDGGRITGARARVGGALRTGGSDLGTVDPAAAVAFLLSEDALEAAAGRAADRMIFAATLADAESWPDLLRIARARDMSSDARRNAVFWVAQAAGDKATAGLSSIVGDDSDELEVRKQAVFALSQIKTDGTVDALIEIARTNPEPELRRTAMFWLGQSGSPRAIAFFEEVLRG